VIKSFSAFEYNQDTSFSVADFVYEGDCNNGWTISRNREHYLSLPSGYELLESLICGICSTDIVRHQLPFPLPQIIGHEIVGRYNNQNVVVDINAAHKHIGQENNCQYCSIGLENHCPNRLTLGIDRLPGGFSPYILVPKYSLINVPDDFDLRLASIVEPFAAALHAVESETIKDGDNVAVVGPRRLGGLLLLALSLWREKNNKSFTITAIIRNESLVELCDLAGADEIVNTNTMKPKKYDVVFDTTGSVSGLELSLSLVKRTVHLKSTNGLAFNGLTHLTQMVVSEMRLLPMNEKSFSTIKQVLAMGRRKILVDNKLDQELINRLCKFPMAEITIIDADLEIDAHQIKYQNRFDIAIAASTEFVNAVVSNRQSISLLKPLGDVYLDPDVLTESILSSALSRGVGISTSRCGDFNKAIQLLSCNLAFATLFIERFVSDVMSAENLPEAFAHAKNDSQAVKVLIKHT